MELLRLALLHFDPIPNNWSNWSSTFGNAEVRTMRSWEIDGKLRLLVAAKIPLKELPSLTNDLFIIVPEVPRKLAEVAIENASNLIAVAEGCKITISSPEPCVALLPKNADSQEWLETTKGFLLTRKGIPGSKHHLDIQMIQRAVVDRFDGLALLAEALSHDHPTGRFHEFFRLLERAFRCGPYQVIDPLSSFLAGSDFGYRKDEVKKWVELRNISTHADRRPYFALQSDIRPVIQRVEQAAYDVFLNKAKWNDRSSERRNFWIPTAGTTSDSQDIFIVKGKDNALEFQILDPFGAYPLDLSACISSLPNGWWSK